MSLPDPRKIDKRLEHVLAEVRKDRGLTQIEVAHKLKKPQSFVSKYETGELKLTVGTFVTVCKALEVDPLKILMALQG